jgi:prepilin-type N-terminal cleavage/methylation domain-containing protein
MDAATIYKGAIMRILQRSGMTLIEVLIVISILAVLLGFILVGIQKARESAQRVKSSNQLRQLALALHGVSTSYNEMVGGSSKILRPVELTEQHLIDPHAPPIIVAAWFAEHPNKIATVDDFFEGDFSVQHKILKSSADPTFDFCTLPSTNVYTSYAYNFPMFIGEPKFPSSIRDGTSNTILFAERYAQTLANPPGVVTFHASLAQPPVRLIPGGPPQLYSEQRRATFADFVWSDVHPVPGSTPNTSVASVPNTTFQSRPRPEDANCHLLQTPYSAGLLVAMADGSVKIFKSTVSETTFWASITPNSGDVAATGD